MFTKRVSQLLLSVCLMAPIVAFGAMPTPSTNYWLELVATNGSFTASSGWYGHGVVVTNTAISSNGVAACSWSGNTNGCTFVSNDTIVITMTNARMITAMFRPTLSIFSAYGRGVPQTNTVSTNNYGVSVSATITNSPVTTNNLYGQATQYVCLGWAATGSMTNAPAGGTNTGPFTITNGTTITWSWATNYKLMALSSWTNIGSVSVATNNVDAGTNLWCLSGATDVVITATASNHYNLLSWSGQTNDCTTNGDTITVPMSQSRYIRANFATNIYTLSATSGVAGATGTPTPNGAAISSNYNSMVRATVTPLVSLGTTQYVCTGWVGTGSFTNGVTTNTGLFALTNNSTVAWLWQTNYMLTPTNTAGGYLTNVTSSTRATNGWMSMGSSFTIVAVASNAVASNAYHFADWSGDTNDCTISSNTILVSMTQARRITATFTRDPSLVVVTPYGIGSPAVGTNWYISGTQVVAAITNSPVTVGTTQYVCQGWTSTGSLGANATGGTNTGPFTITTNSTVTWLWSTNYWLAMTTLGGSVDVSSGWRAIGASFIATATASNGYVFTSWSGATNGCTILGNILVVNSMATPRAVVANFESDKKLIIVTPYGNGSPAAGTNLYTYGTSVSAALTNSPVTDGGTQYVCAGWAATGSMTTNLTGGTNTGSFTITNDTTVTWLWTTNYWLDTTAGANGSVDVADGWKARGSNFAITATASNFYYFDGWSGDTNGCVIAGSTITGLMTQARAITASFAATQFTFVVNSPRGTAVPTPGTTNTYDYNTIVRARMLSGTVSAGTTQYVCSGWTATGTTNASGAATDTGDFPLTNNVDLSWLWTTNYNLGVTSSNCSVNVTNGWKLAGSSLSITATPLTNATFAGWSGDTNGCVITGNTITGLMTQSRAIVANCTVPQYTFVVVSAIGTGSPLAGVTNTYANETSVRARMLTPTVTSGGTQYVSAGWTATGTTNASGSSTNTGFFPLTNNVVVTWLWTTNYNLAATASNCSVNVTNGWKLAGSSLSITATPSSNAVFVGWSGDTNGCVIDGSTITGLMTQARTIVASCTVSQYTFVVVSAVGTGSPLAGVTNTYANGTSVRARMLTPTVTSGGTQYVAAGWTATGTTNSSGSSTNTGFFPLTNNVVVTWLWTTNYNLGVTASNCTVDVTNGWKLAGSSLSLTATPSSNAVFAGWSGDTNGCVIAGSTITGLMTQARTIVANCTVPQYTFVVVSAVGTGSPLAGVTNSYANGTSVRARMLTPTVTSGGTQYVAAGWAATGTTNASGSSTSTGYFPLTNNVVVTWLWTTNYNLGVTASNCTVDVTNGWKLSGSSLSITATPSSNAVFAGWSGDTNGCVIAGSTITVAMTQARAIVANSTIPQYTFVVVSPVGTGSPLAGVTNSYAKGTTVRARMLTDTVTSGGTQYVCAGWTATGTTNASGSSTNTGYFPLTNNVVVTWLWTTNYYVGVTTSNCTVDVANGWKLAGSSLSITATPSSNAVFAGWSGDTNGCVIAGSTITGLMTQARAIVANSTIPQYTFAVVSAVGTGAPLAGVTNSYAKGTSVRARMLTATVTSGGTQYVCAGWTATGTTNASGSSTNTGYFPLTNDVVVTWLWTTNYYLSVTASGSGTVDVVNGWKLDGSSVVITATPVSAAYRLAYWSGATNGCVTNGNVITVPMTQSRTITGVFTQVMHSFSVVSPNGVGAPAAGTTNYYAHGTLVRARMLTDVITSGSTQVVCVGWSATGSIPSSGISTNTGYYALTNDTVVTWLWSTNMLVLAGVGPVDGTGGRTVSWTSEAGAVYSVERSLDLSAENGGFVVVASDIQATPPQNTYVDPELIVGSVFYRIGRLITGN